MSNVELTVDQIHIMKFVHRRYSIRKIAEEIRKSPRTVNVQLFKLEELGFMRNSRPGESGTWENTDKGIKVLKAEGLIKNGS